jgi:hypothetical protein
VEKIMSNHNVRDDGDNNTARWADEDEDELEWLRTAPVIIGNTVYAWFEDQMKWDDELAYRKMMPKQQAAYQVNMEAIDAADMTNSDGDTPTNITPI